MNCIDESQLASLVDGKMSDDELERWLEHCDNCEVCAQKLDSAIGLDQAVREVFASPTTESVLLQVEKVHSNIQRQATSRFRLQALISVAASIAFFCAIVNFSLTSQRQGTAEENVGDSRPAISKDRTRIFDRATIVVSESGEDDSFSLFMVYPTVPEVTSNEEGSFKRSTALIAGVN